MISLIQHEATEPLEAKPATRSKSMFARGPSDMKLDTEDEKDKLAASLLRQTRARAKKDEDKAKLKAELKRTEERIQTMNTTRSKYH